MRGGADRRGMRKPLVIFTPKRMLRHPRAASTVDDLTAGGFREVLDETEVIDPGRVSRLMFCTGQIYYDLLAGAGRAEGRPCGHRAHRTVISVRADQA